MLTSNYTPTPEFGEAVFSGNLLRTRIMLKDSMVVDPTRRQFDKMLGYAKRNLPGIVVPHDGGPLEEDQAKWDLDLMNQELSQLVGNFSGERIAHLWRVIRKVRENDIRRLESQKTAQPHREAHSLTSSTFTRTSSNFSPSAAGSSELSASEKKKNRECAIEAIQKAGKDIERIMMETNQGKTWSRIQVNKIKKAARDILVAAKQYKENE